MSLINLFKGAVVSFLNDEISRNKFMRDYFYLNLHREGDALERVAILDIRISRLEDLLDDVN